jgi:hypothetical protein
MYYNSQETVWNDQSMQIFGAIASKIIGVKFSEEIEKELLYAAGGDAIGIQEGNTKLEGSFKVLKSQLDAWNAAAVAAGYDSILKVPYQAITATVVYKAAYGRLLQGFTIQGIGFTKREYDLAQAGKKMEIDLPFMFLGLTNVF